MKRTIYTLLLLLSISLSGCVKVDNFAELTPELPTSDVVEKTEDGKLRVTVDFAAKSMSSVETATRAGSIAPDENIDDGWCLVFGVDETLFDTEMVDGEVKVYEKGTKKEVGSGEGYGPDSKLLQKTKVIANTNGRFYMTFDETDERVFMRFVLNLSDREELHNEAVVSQAEADADNHDSITDSDVAIFRQFLNSSIGLDGLYDMTYTTNATLGADNETMVYDPINTTPPDPNNVRPALPMSSQGHGLDNGINAESVEESFGTTVELIRTYSKVEVFSKSTSESSTSFNSEFEIESVTLLKGANEARYRSTTLSSTGSEVENFDVIENLGGAVQYGAVGVESKERSKPIYLYPNLGGNYGDHDMLVQASKATFIIIKGKAKGYDDYGYYKVALKAQYPLKVDSNEYPRNNRNYWSPLTYDIWRNAHFSVNLINVDKPGYATFGDAADIHNPASNISYDIVVDGTDNRNEFIGSNGAYFVELETSRIYAKGYAGAAVTGNITFTLNPSNGNYHPKVYVEGEGGAAVTGANVGAFSGGKLTLPASNADQRVTLNFSATSSGCISVRCGDILKHIPIIYESDKVSFRGGALAVNDGDNGWSNFAYSDILGISGKYSRLNANGQIPTNVGVYSTDQSFAAKVYPKDGSGIADVYVKQYNDYILWDDVKGREAENIDLIYDSYGNIWTGESSTSTQATGTNNLYTIKGVQEQVNVDVEGNFDNFPPVGPGVAELVDNMPLNTQFGFSVGNIGTNGGNPTRKAEVTIDLDHVQNESKSYTFNIIQYAVPSIDTSFPPTTTEGYTYVTPKPVNGDDYLNYNKTGWITGNAKDAGEKLASVKVYNCFYKESPNGLNTVDGVTYGWKWENAPATIVQQGDDDADTQRDRVHDAFSVGHEVPYHESGKETDPLGRYGTHTFPITMNKSGTSTSYSKASAFFVLLVRNQVGEQFETRLLVQCQSK